MATLRMALLTLGIIPAVSFVVRNPPFVDFF